MISLKKLLKFILPNGLVNFHYENNQTRLALSQFKYVTNWRASIFQENFKVWVLNPENRAYVKVGNDCMLDCALFFESGKGEIIFGDNVYIGRSTLLCRSKIEFENNIFVAWGVCFYDHDSHSLDYKYRQQDLRQQVADYKDGINFITNKNWNCVNTKPIKVCENAWIGMNSIILKGVTIGEGAIVAAGSIVTRDVAPWTVVAGNPASFVRNVEERPL